MSKIEDFANEALSLRRDGDLLWITLNDPDRANALSPGMIRGLTEIYSTDMRGEGIRAVLLQAVGGNFLGRRGSGTSAFSAGRRPGGKSTGLGGLRALFESVLRQEALSIALVQGACVAGGCGLATAHDFVMAAEQARFMYSEVRIGFVAALVATYLPLRLRGADIRELLLNPDFVGAERALEMGLINRIVPPDELSAAGRSLALESAGARQFRIHRPHQATASRDPRPPVERSARDRCRGQRGGSLQCRLQAWHVHLSGDQGVSQLARGMTTVRLLLFDVDGTLVLGNRSNRRWFGEALIEVFGAAGDIDAYSFSGKIDPQIVTELLTGAGVALPSIEAGIPRVKEAYLSRLQRNLEPRHLRLLPECPRVAGAARDSAGGDDGTPHG